MAETLSWLSALHIPEFAGGYPTVEMVEQHHGAEFESALRQAYDFMRRNGRYTTRTLQRVLALSQDAEDARAGVTGAPMPSAVVLRASMPESYDEETEVKYGGVAAMAVILGPDNKLLLAVHRSRRRHKLGYLLLRVTMQTCTDVQTWVSQHNVEGQHFLLNSGLFPVSVNSSGAVCYALGAEDPVENDYDGGAEVEAPVFAVRHQSLSRRRADGRLTNLMVEDPVEPRGEGW